MPTKTSNITLALAISAVLSTSGQTVIANQMGNSILSNNAPLLLASNQAHLDAFWEGKYTYCDAKLLAAYWKQSIYEAKARAGEKLLRGERSVVGDYLSSARRYAQEHNATCSFYEDGYIYEDAVLLAKYWGKAEPWDAKLKMNRLLMDGKNADIQAALRSAKQQSAQQPANTEQLQWEKYSASKYTFEDAERLASYWGKSTPWEAKLKIGSLLLSGNNAAIKKALQSAKQQPAPQPEPSNTDGDTARDAFWEGQYTYCDAKLLAAYWKQSIYEAKARAGEKLLRGSRSVVGNYLSSARRYAQEHNATCSFDEDGYTYDDAALLAKHWGKATPWDAKLKMNRLLMDGKNADIQKALQSAKQQNQAKPAKTKQ
ncbi:hypothetical protein QUF54_01900 [Candidatus Marithioploca araucensis]|uniref:Uncharacterized protein n=1 Tax=Candidatus Marithioploca araucensis TaxID=70273 RepID=A0ABT7VQY6_9GAMM|nr:hypothetical protein [Candidatus Marithioploca araucensis]